MFVNQNLDELHGLIRSYSFGTLVCQNDGELGVTNLPFLLDSNIGEYGTLDFHIARANPQAQGLLETKDILVTFLGPHRYISPAYYENPKTVPTWNYASVHAWGKPHQLSELELREQLLLLVSTHEANDGNPWDPSLGEAATDKKIAGIIGFRMPIRKLKGIFKFNQNRSVEDRQRVIKEIEKRDGKTDFVQMMFNSVG